MVKHKDIIHCYSNEILKKVFIDPKAKGKIKVLYDVKNNKIGRLVKKKKEKDDESIKDKNKKIRIKKEKENVKKEDVVDDDEEEEENVNVKKSSLHSSSKSETKSQNNPEIVIQDLRQKIIEEEKE